MVVMQWAQRKQTGFTIVELLIVIVVIAILAAITIVAYNGIRQSATKSALASALSQTSRQIMAYAAKNADQYPSSLAAASVSSSGDVAYTYEADNTRTPRRYCLTATQNGTSYFVTQAMSVATPGSCEGLIGWWPLNGSPVDLAGGANGTLSGTPEVVNGQSGASNGAYELDAQGDRVTLPNEWGSGVSFNKITGSAWVRQTTQSGTRGILYSVTGALHWELVGNAWRVRISGTDHGSVAAGPAIGTWAHIAFVHDRATNDVRFYVDGERVYTSTGNSGRDSFFTGDVSELGASLMTSRQWFGAIDDMRVYNRALGDNEIRALYQAGAQ